MRLEQTLRGSLPELRVQYMTSFPEGGMCAVCTHSKRNCSTLPFDRYPVIKRYPDGTQAVRCAEFRRK